MSSVSLQIQEQLREAGYRNHFQYRDGGMVCVNSGQKYAPGELSVQASYRFEENSDPDEGAVLWVLKAKDGTGGVCFDAHGLYGDPEMASFISKIPDRRRRNNLMESLPAQKTIEIVVERQPSIRRVAA